MLNIFLALVSFVGGVYWNKAFFHLPLRLSAFLTSGWVIILLSFGGIFGLLKETYYLLVVLGSIYFLYQLMNKKSFLKIKDLKREWWVLGILSIVLMLVSQLKLSHYDNFSHWALVVKYLTTFGQFPSATQNIVTFTSYPLGSSVFSYFWLGNGFFHEGILLVSHWLLLMLSFLPLSQLVNTNRALPLAHSLLLTIGAVIAWVKFVPMNSVLVDDLISVYAVGAIAGQVYLRSDVKRLALFTAITAGALSLMKNSALFFVGIIYLHFLVLFFHCLKNYPSRRKEGRVAFLVSLFTFLPFTGWQVHLNKTFTTSESSKHAIDFNAYKEIVGGKTAQEIAQIRESFLRHVLDINRPIMRGIYVILLIFFLLYLFYLWKKMGHWWIREVFFLSLFSTISYIVSVYYMYIFSMPTHEAIRLAAFYRYMETLYIFLLVYLTMIVLLLLNKISSKSSNIRRFVTISLICASIGLFTVKYQEVYRMSKDPYQNPSQKIKALVDQVGEPIEVLHIISSDETRVKSGYLEYAGIFYAMTSQVDAVYEEGVHESYIFEERVGEYSLYLP